MGEHGVGRGVETMGEGDSHGRGYLRIARLKVEVSRWKTRSAWIRTVARVLVKAVRVSYVSCHVYPVYGEVLLGHHVNVPAHDGHQKVEGGAQTSRKGGRLNTAFQPVHEMDK